MARYSRALKSLVLVLAAALLAIGAALASCGGSSGTSSVAESPATAATPPERGKSPATKDARDAAEAKHSRGFFHKVASDSAVVYLLGSVHIGKAELFPMDPPIQKAFAEADKLVLEIDMSGQGQQAAQQKMLTAGQYPPGKSLATELAPETLALLKQRLKERGLPYEALARMRPWMLALTLTVLELKRAGYDERQGVDVHFADRAASKEVIALETVEEQLALFSEMSEEEQAQMLHQSLEDLDKTPELLDKALVAWKASDEEALVAAVLAPIQEPQYQDAYQAIFVDRNEAMTQDIEGFLEQEGVFFVVVGAGHVVGEDGIVARLRKRGHEVEQL